MSKREAKRLRKQQEMEDATRLTECREPSYVLSVVTSIDGLTTRLPSDSEGVIYQIASFITGVCKACNRLGESEVYCAAPRCMKMFCNWCLVDLRCDYCDCCSECCDGDCESNNQSELSGYTYTLSVSSDDTSIYSASDISDSDGNVTTRRCLLCTNLRAQMCPNQMCGYHCDGCPRHRHPPSKTRILVSEDRFEPNEDLI